MEFRVFGPSVSWVAAASAAGVAAPLPAEVAELAFFFGARWVSVRPSSRSFSGWVAVVCFPEWDEEAADFFSVEAAALLGDCCFCLRRASAGWVRVSVPVAVSAWESVAVGSLPVFFWCF